MICHPLRMSRVSGEVPTCVQSEGWIHPCAVTRMFRLLKSIGKCITNLVKRVKSLKFAQRMCFSTVHTIKNRKKKFDFVRDFPAKLDISRYYAHIRGGTTLTSHEKSIKRA